MKRLSGVLVGCVLLAVAVVVCCATASAQTQRTAFTGEIWTWDEQASTVTLRQGLQDIRVLVSPDQFIGLRLHETKTIYGVLAPPAELLHTVVDMPSTVVPRGAAEETEVTGTVAAIDGGRITVSAPQGAVQVWRATDGVTFNPGTRARVRMRVQPLAVIPARPGQPAEPAALDPAPTPGREPGDYAVIVGRVLEVDRTGRLTVDSARGPVSVWVANAARYKANDTVEIRTSVHPAR